MFSRRAMLPEPFRSGYRLVLAFVVVVPLTVDGGPLVGICWPNP